MAEQGRGREPTIMRVGNYSGTRQSEKKTVDGRTVTAAPIKFGEYSRDAQGHHTERRTRGMSGAVPSGVHGEDTGAVASDNDEELEDTRSRAQIEGAHATANKRSISAGASNKANRASSKKSKKQTPQPRVSLDSAGVPVDQHLDALDDADKMEAVANDLADELDRVHAEKDDHIEENDFLRKTLAVMQVNKEISEDIVGGLNHVRKNVLHVYACGVWILLLSLAFFAYFIWGMMSKFHFNAN